MSMSIRDDATGLEWAGALGRKGLFPTSENLRNPRYLAMLVEIPRFHRRAKKVVEASTEAGAVAGATYERTDDITLREFLAEGHFSKYFIRHFMEPLVAAVWSCDPEVSLDYPARYLFSFLQHHGMLGIFGSPQWRTVSGGSHEYVQRVAKHIGDIRTSSAVTSIRELPDGVEITDVTGATESYDAVVIAAHPSHALAMLAEPTALHTELLSAMPYSPNTAILHTDTSLLPDANRAWASWNFRRPEQTDDGVIVTYDLTRLQRLDTDIHYLVTLGGEHLIDPATVIDRMEYEHPLYNPTSLDAQGRLPQINTDRIAFAGAYHGWGFHEDGARSGLAAVERLGLTWPTEQRASTDPRHRDPERDLRGTGRIYDTTVRHTRRKPFKRAFTHRTHTWLVDLDDLPDHGLLGRFEARDHLGEPDRSIRRNVEAFLDLRGIDVRAGRIEMATNARAFGYCFNPISVFWCWDAQGELAATVVEVHNTYGDRHAYLVHPDEQGRATTDKAMYVSPFHGTDGTYDLTVPVPGDDLTIVVNLTTDDGDRFNASLTGHHHDTSPLRAAPAALRGSILIRVHGIWLWLRRLPVRQRPQHHQEGVTS